MFPRIIRLSSLYKTVAPFVCTQRSYFGGEFCISWASDNAAHLEVPTATLARRSARREIETNYWTPAYHTGAFALPAYIQKIVDKATVKTATKRKK